MNVKLEERYEASMVLSGVGDAIGYHNGMWEFSESGATIHAELRHDFGGLRQITVDSMVLCYYSFNTVLLKYL